MSIWCETVGRRETRKFAMGPPCKNIKKKKKFLGGQRKILHKILGELGNLPQHTWGFQFRKFHGSRCPYLVPPMNVGIVLVVTPFPGVQSMVGFSFVYAGGSLLNLCSDSIQHPSGL